MNPQLYLVFFVLLAASVALAWDYHKVTAEKADLNQRMCKLMPTQLHKCLAVPGGHLNTSETLADMLKVVSGPYVLLRAEAVEAGYTPEGMAAGLKRVPMELGPVPPPNRLTDREAKPLYELLETLSIVYRHKLKAHYEQTMDTYFLPLAKLKKFDPSTGDYVNTNDEPYSVVVGVFGVRQHSDTLNGISGLKIHIAEL